VNCRAASCPIDLHQSGGLVLGRRRYDGDAAAAGAEAAVDSGASAKRPLKRPGHRAHRPCTSFHWPDETGTRVEDSWAEDDESCWSRGKVPAQPGVLELRRRAARPFFARRIPPRRFRSSRPSPLINRRAAEREIPWCASHGAGVICYSPIAFRPAHGQLQRGKRGAGPSQGRTGGATRRTSSKTAARRETSGSADSLRYDRESGYETVRFRDSPSPGRSPGLA